jgi:hypothetical protein
MFIEFTQEFRLGLWCSLLCVGPVAQTKKDVQVLNIPSYFVSWTVLSYPESFHSCLPQVNRKGFRIDLDVPSFKNVFVTPQGWLDILAQPPKSSWFCFRAQSFVTWLFLSHHLDIRSLLIFFFFYYSYLHTRLGSFLPPAPTP